MVALQQPEDTAIPILNSTFSNRRSIKIEPAKYFERGEKNLGGHCPSAPLGAGPTW